MAEKSWVSMIPKLTLDEMKRMILSLAEQLFPVMETSEKQTFIVNLLGLSGDDKLSSLASR
jgi:hypothetical protein